MSEDLMEPPNRKHSVHWAIKVWLIFHCFAVITRTIPLPAQEDHERAGQKSFSPENVTSQLKVANLNTFRQKEWLIPYYTEGLGFWQYWDMFAPNPAQEDVWVDAEVLMADGSTKIITYPRIYEMPLVEKFFKERYRKYRERLTSEGYSWKWPHSADWFAAKAWTEESNPPTRVILRYHSYLVPRPPEEPTYEYSTVPFYSALIDSESIRSLRP